MWPFVVCLWGWAESCKIVFLLPRGHLFTCSDTCSRMYHLAIVQSAQCTSQMDGWTDDRIMPVGNNTACSISIFRNHLTFHRHL